MPRRTRFESRFLPRGEVVRLDRELVRLGRGEAALRLRVGEALEALARAGGHHELGFSSAGDYALERCERSGRWAAESRAMARRLERLPRVHDALVRGEVSWSMAELVSRHASEETEEALLAEARGATTRAMRARLGAEGPEGPEGPEGAEGDADDDADAEPRRTLTVTVPAPDAWAVELTRMLVEAIVGSRSTDELVEAMLAEGLLSLRRRARGGSRWRLRRWRSRRGRSCRRNPGSWTG